MGNNKKTTDFLKECMSDALISLMEQKDFSKITVNDIADIAGVNRSTWFRNFNSKNEALTFKMIRLWNRWSDEHGLMERKRFTLDNANEFFCFNYEYRRILRIIYTSRRPCVLLCGCAYAAVSAFVFRLKSHTIYSICARRTILRRNLRKWRMNYPILH